MPGILPGVQEVVTQPEILDGKKVEIMFTVPATKSPNQGLPDDPT